MSLDPVGPIDTVHLVREVDEALIPLLKGLQVEDWQRPAVGHWTVRDVVAHLLDGAVRRLSLGRDRHQPPSPDREISDYPELVGYLDQLNALWVEAAGRLSPRVMIDLLEWVCPQVAEYFESLDPEGEASFPVSWAGEDLSRVWMDVAREFSERWHHQQQIREAVGAPGIDQERYVRPLLETLIRALPRAYASIEAPPGSDVGFRISDLPELGWVLRRGTDSWRLYTAGSDLEASSVIEIPADAAWRLFTKGISGGRARSLAKIVGATELADPFFTTLAVMA